MRIAFIGLGNMGRHMAANLQKAGHDVTVHDVRREAAEGHLANGATVNDLDPEHGGTPLLWAAAAGRAEAIELLIGRGADVNAVDRDGGTALHAAAFLGHEKAVDVLIRNGAKVNATNGRGNTPLDGAILDEGTTRYFASLLQLPLRLSSFGQRELPGHLDPQPATLRQLAERLQLVTVRADEDVAAALFLDLRVDHGGVAGREAHHPG